MDWKKLWPAAVALLGVILTAVTPAAQAYVAAHPMLAAIVAALGVFIANLVKSPTTSSPK